MTDLAATPDRDPPANGRPRRTASNAWALTAGAFRDLVWADLRDGVIRVADLPRPTRAMVRIGLVLMAAMIAVLLGGDLVRQSGQLLSAPGGAIGRGAQLPAVLFPVTLFMFSVSWGLMLTGSLRTHWAMRTAVLGIWIAMTLQWLDAAGLARTTRMDVAIYVLLAVGVLSHVVLSRRERLHALEFGLYFALAAVCFLIPHGPAVDSWIASGTPIHLVSLSFLVSNMEGLVLPLLLVIGLTIADFIRMSAGWIGEAVDERMPSKALAVVLTGVGLWRAWSVGRGTVEQFATEPIGDVLASHLGATGIVVIPVLAWWLIRRRGRNAAPDVDAMWDGAEARTLPVAIGYIIGALVVTVGTVVVLGISGALSIQATSARARLADVVFWLGNVTDQVTLIRAALFIGVIVAAELLLRRGRTIPALYLSVIGGVGLWYLLTAPDAWLGTVSWGDFAYVNHLWTLLALLVGAAWLANGRLTRSRQRAVLVVLLITALLAPAEAVGDPFSPFFASAGIAFVAFGIVWDFATSGSWANEGSTHLPRTSRVFLYLGYVLFSVTIIAWAFTTHDLSAMGRLTGDAAGQGFAVLGKPLLYVTFLLLLAPTAPAATTTDTAEA